MCTASIIFTHVGWFKKMNNGFNRNDSIYEKAIERAKCNCIAEAFEGYVQTFLNRITSSMAKNKVLLGIIEGDMVSDLIEETYEEFEDEVRSSQIKISREGRFNLLEEIKIIFPGQFDPASEEELIRVSK